MLCDTPYVIAGSPIVTSLGIICGYTPYGPVVHLTPSDCLCNVSGWYYNNHVAPLLPLPCTYMHTHTSIHVHTHPYMHTHIHTCTHTSIHAHTHPYMHTHIHTCTHTYTQARTHVHIAHAYTCIQHYSVLLHTCTHICGHTQHTHTHTHTHMHTLLTHI